MVHGKARLLRGARRRRRTRREEEIKKAYRKLAMKHHPDRNQGDDRRSPRSNFKEAKEAYEMLSDPQKRAAYDQYGHAGVDPNLGGAAARARRASAASPRPSATSSATSSAAQRPRRARGGQQVYRGSDLQLRDGDHARGGGARQGNADPHSRAARPARPARAAAPSPARSPKTCTDLPRPRRGAHAPGLLQHPADLPALPRQRQDHSRALRHLQRPGPRSRRTRRSRSRFPPASTRACASARAATASRARTAARPATSTSRSASSSTRSSSATATTCTAPCRSA